MTYIRFVTFSSSNLCSLKFISNILILKLMGNDKLHTHLKYLYVLSLSKRQTICFMQVMWNARKHIKANNARVPL